MSLLRTPSVLAYRGPPSSSKPWAVMLAVVLLTGASNGFAQTPQASAPPPSERAAPAKPPENSGLLEEIGKLLTAPAALLPSSKPAEPAAVPAEPAPAPTPAPTPAPPPPPAAPDSAAKDPPAGSRIMPGIVTGRELCPRTENGAPDCKTGSDKLCRGKGYTTGKSLDTDAAFSCSTKPLQTRGRLCGTDTYVIRAFCQ